MSLLFAQTGLAQSTENQQIVFEGSLTDTSGNAIDLASASLTYYVSANGCYLYGESSSTSGDSSGNIIHRIGSGVQVTGSPNSFSQNLFFGNVSGTTTFASNNCAVTAAHTRLVQVSYPAEGINATMKLGTVPYAHNTAKLGGKSAADFVQISTDTNTVFSGGSVGQYLTKTASGLTWSTSSLTAGQISSALGYTPVSTTAALTSASITTALGYVPLTAASATQWTSSATAITYAGRVGIGTSTPSMGFNVIHDNGAGLSARFQASPTSGSVVLGSTPAQFGGNGGVIQALDSVGATGDLQINPFGGNVGVGTFTPIAKLTVSGGIRISMENVTCAASYAGTIRYNSGSIEFCNGSAWSALGTAGTVNSASIATALGYSPANSATVSLKANNLSDLASATLARNNLGLGNLATKSLANLTSDVTGVLPAANGGSKWSNASAGIYSVSNTAIGTASFLSDTQLYVLSSLGQTARIYNSSANGNGLSVSVAGVSSTHSALHVINVSGTLLNVQNDGKIGIGNSTNTALFNLASGSASMAPFKFTSGALTSTPANGSLEYDGANLYITDSTNTRRTIATGSLNSIDNASLINSPSNITMNPIGSVVVSSTVASTSSQTGALIVKGGLGVAGSIHSSGNVTANSFTAPTLNGSSLASENLVFDSTTHATKGNILIAPNGGNVGIGNNAPNTSLHIGDITATPNDYLSFGKRIAASESNDPFIGQDSINGVANDLGLGTRSTNGGINFYAGNTAPFNAFAASGLRMRIAANGSIGIGTTAPTARLHITSGSSTLPPLKLTSGALLSTPTPGSVEYDGSKLLITDGNNTRRRIVTGMTNTSIDDINSINSTGDLFLNASNTVYLSENVVVGGASAAVATFNVISNTGGSELVRFDGGSSGYYNRFTANGVAKASEGILSGSTLFSSEIIGGFGLRAESAIQLGIGTASVLTIATNKNVGIGTTTPTTALTVSGTVRAISGGFEHPDGTVQSTSAFGGYERINIGCGSANSCIATCSVGKKILSGGCQNSFSPLSSAAVLISSFPASDSQWSCQWSNVGSFAVSAWAICTKM